MLTPRVFPNNHHLLICLARSRPICIPCYFSFILLTISSLFLFLTRSIHFDIFSLVGHVRYAQTSIHVYGMLSDLVTPHTSTLAFLKVLFSFLSLMGDRTRTKELIVVFAFFLRLSATWRPHERATRDKPTARERLNANESTRAMRRFATMPYALEWPGFGRKLSLN